MKKTFIDSSRLILIEVCDMKQETDITYLPFKKSFWGNRKEGFYYNGYSASGPYTAAELESGKLFDVNYIIEGEKVFYQPYVRLTFEHKMERIYEFRTYNEALAFGSEKAAKGIDFRTRLEF